ncbi:MAG: TrmH family RNA methyltransferase [Bdellovibrionales bacterium]
MKSIKAYPFQYHQDVHGFPMDVKEAVSLFSPMLTDARKERIEEVLACRTRSHMVVLDHLYDIGNINAVIRTMENLGFQRLGIIEHDKTLKANRITRGADKWLDLEIHQSPLNYIRSLKNEGYKIVSTHLSETAKNFRDIDFSGKIALCLGNERDGVSEELLAMADENCIIPATGFSQSMNISVAAAILLQEMKNQKEQSPTGFGDLTDKEKEILRGIYYIQSAPRPLEKILENLVGHDWTKEHLSRDLTRD